MSDSSNGNREVLERLVHQYRPSIEQECFAYRSLTGTDLSHADLVQEVTMHVLTKIAQFKGLANGLEIAHEEQFRNLRFEAWLRKTARSVLNNLYRERRTQKRGANIRIESLQADHEVGGVDRTASSILRRNEEHVRVRITLQEKLDEQSRDIVLLHIGEDCTFQAIAERLGMTYDQVRHKYRCALKLMESALS